MRTSAALVAVVVAVSIVPFAAQTQQPPPQTPPAKPPAVAQPAATPAQQPFPDGAKIAYCSLSVIAQQSKEGAAAYQKVKAVQDQRVRAVEDKNKLLRANQTLVDSPSTAAEKRLGLQRDIARLQTEIQRMQQDADAEVQDLANDAQAALGRRIGPVIEQVAKEKGLHVVLRAETDAILWAVPGLDLTPEIIRRMDATTPAAVPVKKVP